MVLPGFLKFRIEPVPFRVTEMGFGFGEKVLVIMCGLQVHDHSALLHNSLKMSIVF